MGDDEQQILAAADRPGRVFEGLNPTACAQKTRDRVVVIGAMVSLDEEKLGCIQVRVAAVGISGIVGV